MRNFLRNVWRLAVPYFHSEEKWSARGLLAIIICLMLGIVYMSVQINKWYNEFYDALQDYDRAAFVHAIIHYGWLAAIFIVLSVYSAYFNQMLSIRWRRWLTRHYIGAWLTDQTYYQLQLAGEHKADNPDQRITEDVGQFIDLTLNVTLGIFNSLVTLFSFLFILWTLSGPSFTFFSHTYHIPGQLVWIALLYAFVGTLVTIFLGKPLVKLNYEKQRFEADFRYSLVRLRENTESVAFYHGERQEQASFAHRFTLIYNNTWLIMRRAKILNWNTLVYTNVAVILPYVALAPRYFAKLIKLGLLQQTASAFGQVQSSLSYIINSYSLLATWKSVVDRLAGFADATSEASDITKKTDLVRTIVPGSGMKLENANVFLPNGVELLRGLSLEIAPGRAVQIKGPSGCGKKHGAARPRRSVALRFRPPDELPGIQDSLRAAETLCAARDASHLALLSDAGGQKP